jgi:hypothetical protein
MKSKEEIEQLAKQLCNIPIDLVIDEEERYYKNFQKYDGIIQGYTQCQNDTKQILIDFIKWSNAVDEYGNKLDKIDIDNFLNKQD